MEQPNTCPAGRVEKIMEKGILLQSTFPFNFHETEETTWGFGLEAFFTKT